VVTVPVELAGVALAHLTSIATAERARSVRHPVPGMSGDFLQTLGRPSVDLVLRGAFFGPTAADDLRRLRAAQVAVQPVHVLVQAVDASDLVQTLGFSQVLIAELTVEQRAGLADQFDYTCTLVEYVEPPQPAAPDVFGAIDADLADQADGLVDAAQNTLAQVSGLTALFAAVPNFADPTQELPGMLTPFTTATPGGLDALSGIRDLFGAEG
jgi:hypothetical protein